MSEPMKGGIKDCHLDYKLRSYWIDARDYVTGATSSLATGGATLTCGYTGGGVQTPLWQIGRRNVWGVQIATVGATLAYTWRPSDFDNQHPLYIRYVWTTDAAAASVASFNTAFSTLTTDAAPATPSTGATRAATGVAKTTAAHALAITRPAMIASNTNTFTPSTQAINLAVSVSSLTNAALATDFCWLLGTELLYTPKDLFGDGSRRQARYVDPPLQNMEVHSTLDFKR